MAPKDPRGRRLARKLERQGAKELTRKPPPESGATAKMTVPLLWRLEFSRKEGFDGELPKEQVPLALGLAVSRVASNRVGVELSVEIVDNPAAKMQVAFRAVFTLVEENATGHDLEESLQIIAAQIAPSALYPYLRETIGTSAMKSGLPNLLLPIINFRDFFDPKEIEVPPIPAGVEG
jgi:preprotein translocase subunit SecB